MLLAHLSFYHPHLEAAAGGTGFSYLVGQISPSDDKCDGPGFSENDDWIRVACNVLVNVSHDGVRYWAVPIDERPGKVQ